MRKVSFKAIGYYNNGKEIEGFGYFHGWGNSFMEFEDSPGNQTMAIVEDNSTLR